MEPEFAANFQLISIQARSAGFESGNFGVITINDVPVMTAKNENGHYRGLHIVVINPTNGKVEAAKVFDTYVSSDALDGFIDIGFPEGYIIAAACMDECQVNLS